MSIIKPFRAYRPDSALASQIAALPYDVYTTEEARDAAKDNPYSFLHVDRAEIDMPYGASPHDGAVYEKAAENLGKMFDCGWLAQDTQESVYVYRLQMDGRSQTGIVALTSIDEYISGAIKRHELTREDKEKDRIEHIKSCNAQTGPIFLAHRPVSGVKEVLSRAAEGAPECDFTSRDGIRHTIWIIKEAGEINSLVEQFASVESLYIADGHHRNAAAVSVGLQRRASDEHHCGAEPYNFCLSVLFPADELKIMDYNRVLADLNGLSANRLVERLSDMLQVHPSDSPVAPQKRHEFGMYVEGQWYRLTAKPEYVDETNLLACLDVSILHNSIIAPIFNVLDVRNDNRIDFIGGIKGVSEIERVVDGGGMKLGFSLFPTSMEELMGVADMGSIMPPKSTWFEPKLRSGLFVHRL